MDPSYSLSVPESNFANKSSGSDCSESSLILDYLFAGFSIFFSLIISKDGLVKIIKGKFRFGTLAVKELDYGHTFS